MNEFWSASSYEFSWYAVPVVLVGVLCLVLGIATMHRERGSSVSVMLFVTTISLAIWLLSFGGAYSTPDEDVARIWIKASLIGTIFLPACVLTQCASISARLPARIVLAALGFGLAIIFSTMVMTTDWILADIHRYYWGYYPIYGVASPALLTYHGLFLVASAHVYRMSYQATQSGTQRQRLKALFLALIVANPGNVDFLPTYHIGIYPFGYAFIALFIIVATYAIWRYRLIDITPALAARQIIDTMAEGLLVIDRDGIVRVANRAAETFAGLGRGLVGVPGSEIDARWGEGVISSMLDPDGESSREFTYAVRGDVPYTAIASTSKLRDHLGEWVGTVCMIHDISERKQSEDALRSSEALYRTLIETSPDAVIVIERNGQVLMTNERAMQMLGVDRDAPVAGRNSVDFVTPEDRARLRDAFAAAQDTIVTKDADFSLVRTDGSLVPVELSVSTFAGPGGDFRIMAIARDITERKRNEEQIRYLAFHDSLTGADTRAVLMDRMAKSFAHARRARTGAGIIFVDLDGFKQINDTQGHDAGDNVLRFVAKELREILREGDTLARVGGDEFVLLLSEIHDPAEAELIAQRVLQRLASGLGGRAISASLGIATFPRDGDDPDTLLRRSDSAMYVAKNDGGNRYYVCEADDAPELERRAG